MTQTLTPRIRIYAHMEYSNPSWLQKDQRVRFKAFIEIDGRPLRYFSADDENAAISKAQAYLDDLLRDIRQ